MTIAPHALSRLSRPSLSSSPPMLPLLPPHDLSTALSSAAVAHAHQLPRDAESVFLSSRSRVLRFYNPSSVFLHNLFIDAAQDDKSLVPIPKSLWTRRAEYAAVGPTDGVWAVFGTHEEARSALAFLGATVSVSPALESDLEPLHSLQRIQLRAVTGLSKMSIESPIPVSDRSSCDFFSSQPGFLWPSPNPNPLHRLIDPNVQRISPAPGVTLSSNPPNPRNSFRLGDWMCPSPHCAAHNFGRNFTCIGCGCRRPSTSHVPSVSAPRTPLTTINPAQVPSPRFAAALEHRMPASLSHRIPHILTPSGRAFSVGGRVQDVSSDPLLSCFLFWPDNEPLPEQGQIRPRSLDGAPHPPILNTGNRGPIEHQPGDWACRKCHYHNWRRRKVCQTCYPYAEGNGDSIPYAVQADRIKRLRETLTATVTLPPYISPLQTTALDHDPQPRFVQVRHPCGGYLNSCGCQALRSRDQAQLSVELGSRYKDTIYQTSTPPYSSTYRGPAPFPIDNASGRFLPSCLQDVIQSPSLSPTSTTSADLSLDEYIASPVSVYSASSAKLCTNGDHSLHVHRTPSSVNLNPGNNIWQLDGEESKALSSSLSPQNEIFPRT